MNSIHRQNEPATMMNNPGVVLIVEDETEIRELIRLHVNRAGFQTLCAGSAEEGLKLIQEQKFALVVLDWMLPGMSGVDLIRELRQNAENNELPVLMVTAKSEPHDIVMGLEQGADDYVTKPFEVNVLIARVKALYRRFHAQKDVPASEEKIPLGPLMLDLKAYEVTCDGSPIQLTPSEFKLLRCLAYNKGRVLTRDQLIGHVQGDGISVVGRTVDTHIFGLRKKLGEKADVIETVRGVGYRVKG